MKSIFLNPLDIKIMFFFTDILQIIMFLFSNSYLKHSTKNSLPLYMQSYHPLLCSVRDGIVKAAVSLID